MHFGEYELSPSLIAIGLLRVFSLGGWARRILSGFHVSRDTQVLPMIIKLTHKGLSPAMADLSKSFRFVLITIK